MREKQVGVDSDTLTASTILDRITLPCTLCYIVLVQFLVCEVGFIFANRRITALHEVFIVSGVTSLVRDYIIVQE